jgi:predicted GNAT family N-acyltransferase
MQKIISFTIADKTHYKMALEIRKKVFIEEQQVPPELEVENEDQATYYLLLVDEKPVGTARYRKTYDGIKLERFAVLPEYRNQHLGSLVLTKVLEDLKENREKIYLHSQLKAVPYYQRQGFAKQGEMFVEANIQHFIMVLRK